MRRIDSPSSSPLEGKGLSKKKTVSLIQDAKDDILDL
ncbi:hypothetical protein A2U01_0033874, partial [Trifolium medium]|nr:hypothetical protein [Trifolium medium]